MSESNSSHQNAADIPRVSLKQTLEKLFGDEQLQRTEHIQYVADLLISHPTDQCLEGLSLDLLDFDLETNSVVARPAALVSSRKHTVSTTPITWYVNSIAQLAESEENALIWNILVLKAAIYLIALPDIKPELFKEDYTEHFNTVKRLFQRFRVANRVLNPYKEYQNTREYMILWEKHLKDPTLSLTEFVQYLSNFNTDPSNDFEKNLLNNLRITFTYILNNKAKIAKASIETQLQHDFLDEDQLIVESSEIKKGQKSKALNIEEQLDDQDTRQILVDPAIVTPLAAYSESCQSYVLPLIAKHIQRKEHLLPYSNLFPNTASVRALLNRLYDDYTQNKNGKVSLILILSFLTGNKIQEWLRLQSKRVKALNSRQKILQQDEQYFLRTKFSIFENKDFAYPESLLNQTIYLDIPIPNSFIDSLRDGDPIMEEDLQQHLKQLRTKLYIPKLSLIKISSLLHQTILQRTGNKQLADLLTGIDANKSSSISYCHQSIQTLQTEYVSILKELCESLSKDYQNIKYAREKNFGSRKAPTPSVIKGIFTILKYRIFSQKEDDWIAIFNHYNIWMWHFLLLFTAARPVAEFPGFLKSFNLKRKILMVSDKEVGGRQGYGRLIPLCHFVVQELLKFIDFLHYFKTQITPIQPEISNNIQQILESKLPLLNIFQDGQWQPLRPSTVEDFHPELGLEHENWHRHIARAFLSNKISEIEILALFGHEPMQQEAAHPYSSLSISQYSSITHVLEQMKDYFNITGIELDVLIQ
ncbi:hypothetical protein [Acinetobacter gerneri]|uniref:Uncharacterized protein n=2 Tax=Acinetobacter gerneri TaxID=202952 RepID=N8YG34_9GAMM|nr:hypothetical protein [Acinetobacter gerneri]ENV35631.1 hypothetical protein F960_00145 [Acinetobacter gerneri DSM 14967 = CIP 107464 = MTCC 9824]EPR81390.1 hypothetical protein L289_3792 [Acinetobacter gerneri DSM 14967 = CIP 107464 = MTCC 9824]MDQ9011923.1 hypothetical protein [Acinetobacter gerneri]MDQ9016028.1 hypothetical protein [Acinetobacter gerneri]MDQ9027199.1 hypothetical protein [Acinetobacter gerneri]